MIKKVLKKIMVGTSLGLTLTAGAGALMPCVAAYASTATYDQIRVHNVCKQNGNTEVVVEMAKDVFEQSGITINPGYASACTSVNYFVGTKSIGFGTVSAYYNYDMQKYIITFNIDSAKYGFNETISVWTYYNGQCISDDNNGYGYRA